MYYTMWGLPIPIELDFKFRNSANCYKESRPELMYIPVVDPELSTRLSQGRIEVSQLGVVHGGKEVVQQVVSQRGHVEQRAEGLVHVAGGVQLVQAPVRLRAWVIARVVHRRVVVRADESGEGDPVGAEAVHGQPAKEAAHRGELGQVEVDCEDLQTAL